MFCSVRSGCINSIGLLKVSSDRRCILEDAYGHSRF